MAWKIILQDENGNEIDFLDEEFTVEFLSNDSKNEAFKLIKYLDPFGDTIFNRLQMNDLILDLEKLLKLRYDKDIQQIIELALQCQSSQHTYLAFHGD